MTTPVFGQNLFTGLYSVSINQTMQTENISVYGGYFNCNFKRISRGFRFIKNNIQLSKYFYTTKPCERKNISFTEFDL